MESFKLGIKKKTKDNYIGVHILLGKKIYSPDACMKRYSRNIHTCVVEASRE